MLCTETQEFVSFDQLDDGHDAVKELQLKVLYKQEKSKSILHAFVDQMQPKSRNSVSTDREYRRRDRGQRREKKSNRGRKRELESWERKKAGNYVEMSSLPACFSPSAMQTGAICHLAQNGISGACFRDWGIEGRFLSLISWTSILSLFIFKPLCSYLSAPGRLYYPPRLSETQRKWCD